MKTLILYILAISINITSLVSQVPAPVLNPGEYWTNLYSASYDFQSYGSVRYIVQDPSNPLNLCAVLMAGIDSINVPPSNVNRFIFYSYSTNGGKNWMLQKAVDSSTSFGYPSISLNNGKPVIACHKNSSGGQPLKVYRDNSFGSSLFTEITGLPVSPTIYWPQIASSSDGRIIVTGASTTSFNLNYSYYNGSSWSTFNTIPANSPGAGTFTFECGNSGKAAIFTTDQSSGTLKAKLFLSTDNGTTFNLQTGNNAPHEVIQDGLITDLTGGKDCLFDINNDVHLIYSVYDSNSITLPAPPRTNWFKNSKIIHWSQTTGIDTIASGRIINNLSDTITQTGALPLCNPVIGMFDNYLYCAFTAYLNGNVQTVQDNSIVNAGEIFISFSADNGNTWSIPQNITNTPFIEEKYPAIVKKFNRVGNDSLGIYYIRDMIAGPWALVAAWGKAPNYSIYKKISPQLIGIENNSGVVNDFRLYQNYPNPFNPVTTIKYYLPKSGYVKLSVHNILGEEIKILFEGTGKQGDNAAEFKTELLPSGIYFYRLKYNDQIDTKKMVMLK